MSLVDDAADWLPRLQRACDEQRAPYVPRPRAHPSVVHTLYWGAHRFDAGTPQALGDEARRTFDEHAPGAADFADALGLSHSDATRRLHAAVGDKLAREPIEDLRLDFEDGYGHHGDAEEDRTAIAAAEHLATAVQAGHAPRAMGVRIKPLTPELATRALATLDHFVGTLAGRLDGTLPPGFVVTLPKVTVVPQLEAIDALVGRLEARLRLPEHAIGLEFMVEVPGAVFDGDGALRLPRLLAAAGPRLVGVHLGVYDLTAALGIGAAQQAMDHPACDLVRGLIALTWSGTGRTLSAGSTNVLPVGPYAEPTTDAERRANRVAVHRGWRLAHDQIRHVLRRGYAHGWDLHPAQLPARFAACYGFYRDGVDTTTGRLHAYLKSATAATDDAAVLDDVATGEALLGMLRRGHACGALGDEHLATAGITAADLARPSFADVLAARRG